MSGQHLAEVVSWEAGKRNRLFKVRPEGRQRGGGGAGDYNSQKPLLPGESVSVAMVSENNMAAPSWDASLG